MKNNILKSKYLIIIIPIILCLILLVIVLATNKKIPNETVGTGGKQRRYRFTTTATTTRSLYVNADIKYYCGSSNMWLKNGRCYWTDEIDAFEENKCPTNYYYSYTMKKCESSNYDPTTGDFKYNYVDATTKYSCLISGYTLEGTKCKKTESIPAAYNATCPGGYTFENSSMKCKRVGN